jgi:hypothetical protein
MPSQDEQALSTVLDELQEKYDQILTLLESPLNADQNLVENRVPERYSSYLTEFKSTFQRFFALPVSRILALTDYLQEISEISKSIDILNGWANSGNWEESASQLHLFSNSVILFITPIQESFMGNLRIIQHNWLLIFVCLVYQTRTEYPESECASAVSARNSFVRTGLAIRTGHKFESSFMKRLETFLLNRNQNVSELFDSDVVNAQYGFDKSFVAFAAPSMEGKTQSAFVFKDINPLYFPLVDSQPIYKNFRNLSNTLNQCARRDFELLGKQVPTASTLRSTTWFKTRLFTVGFLKTLTEQVQQNDDLTS